ncbi:MAG TPA: AI-2E family transporter, partial [Candidatus Krumholzibacterium sp.]|nr:AI-2E family transporter [Candidatus Krumholzibacterium sp.]
LPAILQALIQFGLGKALVVAACYVVVNMVIGNFIEPRFMGRGLGLSTLAVFLSLIFWGWVLGPVGMLLSVVLTVTVKIVLESREDTRWLAILLGSKVPGIESGEAGPPGVDSDRTGS